MVLSQTSFNCANIGDNSVTLTAIDVNMNTDSCQAAVTISDSVVPNARCNDSTITLDAGKRAVVSVEDVRISNMKGKFVAFSFDFSFTCSHALLFLFFSPSTTDR